jgi:hypothetical protein
MQVLLHDVRVCVRGRVWVWPCRGSWIMYVEGIFPPSAIAGEGHGSPRNTLCYAIGFKLEGFFGDVEG